MHFTFNASGNGWECLSYFTGLRWDIRIAESGAFVVYLENERQKPFRTYRDAVLYAETMDMKVNEDNVATLEALPV